MKSIQAQVATQIRNHLKFMGITAKVTSSIATHSSCVKIVLSTSDMAVEAYVEEYAKQFKRGHSSDLPKVDYISVQSQAKRLNKIPTKADFIRAFG